MASVSLYRGRFVECAPADLAYRIRVGAAAMGGVERVAYQRYRVERWMRVIVLHCFVGSRKGVQAQFNRRFARANQLPGREVVTALRQKPNSRSLNLASLGHHPQHGLG